MARHSPLLIDIGYIMKTAPLGAALFSRDGAARYKPFTTSTTRSTVNPKCGISASIGADAP